MSNIKIGYKIVGVKDGIYFSIGRGAALHDNDYVIYNKNQKTFPIDGNGPLCVFNKRENAFGAIKNLAYNKAGAPFSIFRCWYSQSSIDRIWIYPCATISINHIIKSYPGTRLADWVQLYDEVHHGTFPEPSEW